MLLDLKNLRGEHDRIERRYEVSVFAGRVEEYEVAAPVRLSFDISRRGDEYRLVGDVSTTLALTCARCLERFGLPLDARFDLRYVPAVRNRGEGELEVAEEDLSTAYYRDDELDLGQMLREQFYLGLPMKPLCSEDCRGLCPQCGTNLNLGACGCREAWGDPRLSALRALLESGRQD